MKVKYLNFFYEKRNSKFMFSTIKQIFHKENQILNLVLDNVKGRNALSKEFIKDLNSEIDFVDGKKDIRTIIFTSSDKKIFCAGADLKERLTMSENDTLEFVRLLRSTFHRISKIKIPTFSCIDGFALGGGLELALSTDIRVCSKNSVLGLPETSLGIIPGAGGTQRLSRLIGCNKAKELIFTGQKLNSEECLKLGIVNHICENGEESFKKCIEISEQIIKNAPLAVISAKNSIDEGNKYDLDKGLEIEDKCYQVVLHSKDRIEGLKAFNEKRQPKYLGI